jgi:16S rRNA (cytosine1402-N4)-methyltransferase
MFKHHIPIMLAEVEKHLIHNDYGTYVDCTFGDGGHTCHLLNKFKNIKIIALDYDEHSLCRFNTIINKNKFNGRLVFIRDNFKNIKKVLKILKIHKVDGILADIGMSSQQLNDLHRGFSFKSTMLDMRMDNRLSMTAKKIINYYSLNDLADIFYYYGEEYQSKKVAQAIVHHRKKVVISSAKELQKIICSVKKKFTRIHPATKVFQALRIFVNDELDNLKTLLSIVPVVLNNKGRIVIISFHSLEDRIVKLNFKDNAASGMYTIITKKVIKVTKEELDKNYRSRSARMRVAEKN